MFASSSSLLCDNDASVETDQHEDVESIAIGQIVGVNFDNLVSDCLVSECEDSGFLFAELLQKIDGHDSESESVISVGENESVVNSVGDDSDGSEMDPMEKYFLRNREAKPNVDTAKAKRKQAHNSHEVATVSKKLKIDQSSQPGSTGIAESHPGNVGAHMILVHTDLEQSMPISSSSQSILMPRAESSEQFLSDGKQKCMSKNAVMARENRQRKKQQFNELEQCIGQLREEKDRMKVQVSEQSQKMKAMQKEIEYLRSVIANETGLSALLKSIRNTGLQFGTPLNRPNNAEVERDSNVSQRIPFDQTENVEVNNVVGNGLKTNDNRSTRAASVNQQSQQQEMDSSIINTKSPGGVCLNVSNNIVSVEFCANCSSKSLYQGECEELFTAVPVKPHVHRVVSDVGDHSYGKM